MKSIMMLSCITAAIVSSGCYAQASDHYRVYIDPQFSTDEKDDILTALNEWASTIPELKLDIVVSGCAWGNTTICINRSSEAAAQAIDGTKYELGGLTKRDEARDSSDIFVAMDALNGNRGLFIEVMMHEFGHANNMVHTGNGTLMCFASWCAVSKITCTDQLQWYSLRGKHPFCSDL